MSVDQYKAGGKGKLPRISDIAQYRWSDDLRSVPEIQWTDIRIYLQLNCHWSKDNFTVRKQDKGYQLYQKGHIHRVQCYSLADDEHIYVRASCNRDFSHTGKPYEVWCLLDIDGTINAAGCLCTNDEGDCKHVIALLFCLMERGGRSGDSVNTKLLQQLTSDLTEMKESNATFKAELKAMKQDLDNTKTSFQIKLDAKERELEEAKKAFEELKREISAIKTELNTKTKRLNETLSEVETNINNSVQAMLAQEIGKIERKLEAKDQKYAKIESQFQQHMTAMECDLKSKIGEVDEKISDIETNMNNSLKVMKTECEEYLKNEDLKMSKIKTEIDNVTTSVAKMEDNVTPAVSFSAYKVNIMYDSQVGVPVVFEGVRDNYGKAYNTSTGIFTAPADGTYFFYVSILSLNTPAEYCLYKGSETILFILADSRSGYDEACGSAVVHLEKGNGVCVKPSFRRGHGKFYAHHAWSHFCGFLVHSR